MCFTNESGPRSHGTQAKTLRPSPSAMPAHKNVVSKRRAPRREEEEETLYIRSSMEEEEEEAYLETCIEVSYIPTRSPRQIKAFRVQGSGLT